MFFCTSGDFISKCDKEGENVCAPNVIWFTIWNVRDILNMALVFEEKTDVKFRRFWQETRKIRRLQKCSGFCALSADCGVGLKEPCAVQDFFMWRTRK